jgi:hypothetical protein
MSSVTNSEREESSSVPDDNSPATKQHIRLLKQDLHELEERIDAKFQNQTEQLTEAIRVMQTELLCGFASFSEAQTIRLR